MNKQRALSAAEAAHLAQATAFVDEAARHHRDATAAHGKGDDRALAAAHRNVGRCLRAAQQHFRDMGETGDGDSGGSTDERGSPLLHGDISGWLARARVGARRAT
jgi:hypothetical protein